MTVDFRVGYRWVVIVHDVPRFEIRVLQEIQEKMYGCLILDSPLFIFFTILVPKIGCAVRKVQSNMSGKVCCQFYIKCPFMLLLSDEFSCNFGLGISEGITYNGFQSSQVVYLFLYGGGYL